MTDFNPKTVKPSRSVPIRFIGREIASTQWDTKHGTWMRFTVYETRGGAYIAVTEGSTPGKPDQIEVTATVVEPGEPIAMQIAVIEFFSGHDRAKQMLKNELGWAPFREVA